MEKIHFFFILLFMCIFAWILLTLLYLSYDFWPTNRNYVLYILFDIVHPLNDINEYIKIIRFFLIQISSFRFVCRIIVLSMCALFFVPVIFIFSFNFPDFYFFVWFESEFFYFSFAVRSDVLRETYAAIHVWA